MGSPPSRRRCGDVSRPVRGAFNLRGPSDSKGQSRATIPASSACRRRMRTEIGGRKRGRSMREGWALGLLEECCSSSPTARMPASPSASKWLAAAGQ
ncbi:hypothetical protein MIND_01419300 [Mycena indigotica]|uniref:Uncharacterized protein n=1 Tax=Mycena indigotica TaxID=2126181 RepID=A0A8H6RXH9_9AGAR|nr:uncharacterized protein MIND_01419300 [Mycena indigotica]KAF7288741.1 hypothetical protein MIND_01419300 [Mycena indigotica]